MANQLKMDMVSSILTLKQRGRSGRRIARELGLNREMVAKYIHLPGAGPKPARNAPIGFIDEAIQKFGPDSQCEPFRQVVQDKLQSGLSRQRIYSWYSFLSPKPIVY